MRRTLRKTLLYSLPAAVLVLGGIVSLGAQHYLFRTDAEPADWEPAARHVRQHVGERDTIRTHPPWNLDGLPYLEPVGEQIDRKRHPVTGDLYRADDVWVLTETPLLDDAIARLPFEPEETETQRFGDVSVVRAKVPASAKYDWEALDALSEATVERVDPKDDDGPSVRECTNWDGADRRWDCGNRDRWLYVGDAYKMLGGDARSVIWAHPLPGKKRLRITFSDVPLGDLLRVRAGFTFVASRHDRGKPVRMTIKVDGETRARDTFPILESTWDAYDVDTSSRAGETGELTLVIWSPGFRDRYFCFNAWTR